jgi:hypothetical protein
MFAPKGGWFQEPVQERGQEKNGKKLNPALRFWLRLQGIDEKELPHSCDVVTSLGPGAPPLLLPRVRLLPDVVPQRFQLVIREIGKCRHGTAYPLALAHN